MRKLVSILFILFSISSFAQMGGGAAQFTAYTRPQYGVLIQNVTGTTTHVAQTAKDSLGCLFIRTPVKVYSFNGNSPAYNTNALVGLRQHVNLDTYANGSPTPWNPTSGYADTVGWICRTYPQLTGAIWYVDNEEMNLSYHSQYILQYLQQCALIRDTLHKYNIRMGSGGFGNFGAINMWTYRWIQAKYGLATADNFADSALTTAQRNAAHTPGLNPTFDTLINKVDSVVTSGLFDVINVHLYEVIGFWCTQPDTVVLATTPVMRYVKEAMEDVAKVPCTTNETGQRANSQSSMVTNYLGYYYKMGYWGTDWWSGNTDTEPVFARPLTDTLGTPYANGTSFKTFVQLHNDTSSGLP